MWVLENTSSRNGHWNRGWHINKAALIYFGHVVREERGMENYVMFGRLVGRQGEEGQEQDGWTL